MAFVGGQKCRRVVVGVGADQRDFASLKRLAKVMEDRADGGEGFVEPDAHQGLQVRDDLRQQVFDGAAGAVFADGVHFPFAAVTVDFRHDLCGMGALCA